MNCKPGDLARIVYSKSSNDGRLVSVIRLISADEAVRLWAGCVEWEDCGPIWLVQPLQPLRKETIAGKLLGFVFGLAPIDDCRLRPIKGEPIEDEAPADVVKPVTVEG